MSATAPSSAPASLQPLSASAHDHPRLVKAMLNLAHAVDHLFLLIFAAAVATIAVDFGFSKWEDLMPYGAGAFLLFGLGSVPSGRLGDLWGRRSRSKASCRERV